MSYAMFLYAVRCSQDNVGKTAKLHLLADGRRFLF